MFIVLLITVKFSFSVTMILNRSRPFCFELVFSCIIIRHREGAASRVCYSSIGDALRFISVTIFINKSSSSAIESSWWRYCHLRFSVFLFIYFLYV